MDRLPNFPAADLPALPAGFVDVSYGNDAMPSYLDDRRGLVIWINYADPARREAMRDVRYGVSRVDADDEWLMDCVFTDDWSDVLAFLAVAS